MNTIPFKGSASFVVVMAYGSRMLNAQKELDSSFLVCSKFEDPPLLGDYSADTVCFVIVTCPCTTESHPSNFVDVGLIKIWR
jgi:hypothetical protein